MAILNLDLDNDSKLVNADIPQQHARYTLLPEHAPHSHTLMAYPSIESADDEPHLHALQSEIVGIANAISSFEPVHLYTRDELIDQAKSQTSSNVIVRPALLNELWIRDSGPVYVRNASTCQRTAINFNFNYWGNKLPFKGDEHLATRIIQQTNDQSIKSRLTMEGGAIEHDGQGTFLGAESCIINDNRNKGWTKADIETELKTILGVSHFIWIPGLKNHDITDYHIDALARFTEPGVILLSKPFPTAPSIVHKAYDETRTILQNSKDAKGRSLTIYDCEEPDTTALGPPDANNEVVASYANYLLVNGGVIIPKFGQEEQDSKALELFKRLFPTREVV